MPNLFTLAILVAAAAGMQEATTMTSNTDAAGDLSKRLRDDVTMIASTIGPRDVVDAPDALEKCAVWIEERFKAATGRDVMRESFDVGKQTARNVYVDVPGAKSPEEIVIVGAHYDSIPGCPAANDNGSGVAVTLALADRLGKQPHARTIRFVAFVNEEPPYFLTPQMGSLVHASACKKRGEKIVGMVSLETIGYFSDAPGSQRYPAPGMEKILPTVGNFIAAVGNTKQQAFVDRFGNAMKAGKHVPVQAQAVPAELAGVGWSDHWSFWQNGYDAVMITDTAPFRYPHYHQKTDTPDKLDYARMAGVVDAVADAVIDLADGK